MKRQQCHVLLDTSRSFPVGELVRMFQCGAYSKGDGSHSFATRAYEPRYNVSVWHIKLEGVSEELYMKKVQADWHNSQRLHQDRMVLKHLRYSRDLRPAFEQMLSLMQQTHGIPTVLEHPLITELFNNLVLQRKHSASEATMERICQDGLMQEYPSLSPNSYAWKAIGDVSLEKPSARGGHAICAYNGTYWLFGGYDFWKGFLDGDLLSWTRIKRESETCPDFRSRYRMAATDSHVYMVGVACPDDAGMPVNESFGLVTQDLVDIVSSTDASSRADTATTTPLWEYEIASNRWRPLPELGLSARETVTSIEWKINHYMHSLAMYDINEGKWTQFDHDETTMLSRYGGKSSDSLHAECYDVANDRHVILSHSARGNLGGQAFDIERIPTPTGLVPGTFSTRLFANPDGLSLTLVAGNNGECIIPSAQKQTSVYTFSIVKGEWKQLEMIDALHPDLPETPTGPVHFNEVTKCGHEFVYDRVSGRSIFYGGQTASATTKENVAVELVLYGFLEILHLGSSLESLEYLQSAVSAVTDPSDGEEQRDLKALFTMIVRYRGKQMEGIDDKDSSLLEAFAEILCYVSSRYKEPKGEITCNMQS
ncbi:hypothetical protein QFC21_000959 [Naganishia friedmannii]|uniref:Uncharacterized protein n=1 Tax=Naganishia friedmannii TaxID=89922 RepID=A0ACC2W7T5_9TREE|nr:hypothetical protein QFC21_000959 [Naganishia friedmannii]